MSPKHQTVPSNSPKPSSGNRASRDIADFMTRAPHSIGRDQTLATAHRMMRTHRVRHLPVLDGGKLLGIVSQRDLYFIETLQSVEMENVRVDEAMSPETYHVTPTTPLEEVVQAMAEHKYGCAIVVDAKGAVVGIFTTVDALRAFGQDLRGGAVRTTKS